VFFTFLDVDIAPHTGDCINDSDREAEKDMKYSYGNTPLQTFLDAIPITGEKMIGYEAAVEAQREDVRPSLDYYTRIRGASLF
jgi:hypothetical protein